MNNLFARSIEIIKANQSQGGAYLASPNFAQYRYCWFRDGVYIAYAMDLVGEHDSAFRFYNWAASIITARAPQVERAVAAASHGRMPPPDDILHTRYTVEGNVGGDEWPNFQLDGFGTLLWGMSRHLALTGRSLAGVPGVWYSAITLLVQYLGALWKVPCYDCWEEFGDKVHTYTLAALYGGLQAADEMLRSVATPGSSLFTEAVEAAQMAALIERFVLHNCVSGGTLCKSMGNPEVDGNLVNVATPYRLLPPDDQRMVATVARIEAELRREGHGVHRYSQDSYYGGGEWVLLAAYLGWYYVERGDKERAQALLNWVEGSAHFEGALPEQIPCHLNYPNMLPVWETRWGKIAMPLLWSHAAYLTLATHLRK